MSGDGPPAADTEGTRPHGGERLATPVGVDPSRDARIQMLAEAVPLAYRLAAQHCRTDPLWGRSCELHHGTWPCARLLGLVGDPALDAEFFGRALAPFASLGRPPRVLISGASDHGFPEVVIGALQACGTRAELHLVDRCETPLLINRWYANRVGAALDTVQSDILTYAPDRPFDVIAAHSFIDQLPPPAWPDLLAAWRRALAPGGTVVALNPLRTEDEAARERQAASEARDFRPLIERVNAGLPPLLQVPVEPLSASLSRHWARREPTPFRSRESVVGLFERAGFVVESAEEGLADIPGRAVSRSRRLRVVARSP